MTTKTVPVARRAWTRPRVTTLSTAAAQAGLVAVVDEGLAKGS